ncbi:MAG: phage virion morphogenesis protein [Pseudodesulfovibrio sp.]|uniref:phage virion morphogenesis protein n=1 Tax=Pseudodesulfovibrio sp. TaxID=2035812 RepID=UPI003D12DC0A
MGGTSFKLDWGGMDRMLGTAITKAGQSKAALEVIGEALASSTEERFRTSTAPDGTQWKPSQRAEREGGKTLVNRNETQLRPIGYEVSPDHVVWGSNGPFARIHQLGGKTGRGHAVELPARAFLGMSEEDIKEARAILADHLIGILGGGK